MTRGGRARCRRRRSHVTPCSPSARITHIFSSLFKTGCDNTRWIDDIIHVVSDLLNKCLFLFISPLVLSNDYIIYLEDTHKHSALIKFLRKLEISRFKIDTASIGAYEPNARIRFFFFSSSQRGLNSWCLARNP